MQRRYRFSGVILATVLVSEMGLARITTVPEGVWPDSWPKELDPCRKLARTVWVAHGIQETVYEIGFSNRAEFEDAWPHILRLKSKGAPLILERSPSTYDVSGTTAETGVRVLWPADGFVELPDGTRLKAGPPWPEGITSPSGELPEYVVVKEGKWVPFDGKNRDGFLHRARVVVVLITDGNVVDLNRIPLPSDTPIIDRRFSPRNT